MNFQQRQDVSLINKGDVKIKTDLLEQKIRIIINEIQNYGIRSALIIIWRYFYLNYVVSRYNKFKFIIQKQQLPRRSTVYSEKTKKTPGNSQETSSRKIALITGCPGDSMRYRISNLKEILTNIGYVCDIYYSNELKDTGILTHYTLFILHRVQINPYIKAMIQEGKKKGNIFVFETDDLIFNCKYLDYFSPYQEMDDLERKIWYDSFARAHVTLSCCDFSTVSTRFLQTEMKEYNIKSFLIPNVINKEMVEISKIAVQEKKPHYDKIVIGYFSGTKTHNRDFLLIEKVMMEIFNRYKNVELVIGGLLDLSDSFNPYSGRIRRIPHMHWKRLPYIMCDIDINLAPLEQNPFCESKSDLKFIEAAILKIPTVASNIGGYREYVRNYETGILCSDQGEWIDGLSKLISDEELRVTIGKNAYDYVIHNRTTETICEVVIPIFNELFLNSKDNPVFI